MSEAPYVAPLRGAGPLDAEDRVRMSKSLYSFLSVTSTTATAGQHADYRGFIHAIDSEFKLSNIASPLSTTGLPDRKYPMGYDGTFKIIDHLVWTDLFAMNYRGGEQDAETYWALAAQHPWGVYVGPTTGVRRIWREINGLIQGFARVRSTMTANLVE